MPPALASVVELDVVSEHSHTVSGTIRRLTAEPADEWLELEGESFMCWVTRDGHPIPVHR